MNSGVFGVKPQISSIFHFDRVSDGQMAHVLGVNTLNVENLLPRYLESRIRDRTKPPKN
jgi:hypothetical protein